MRKFLIVLLIFIAAATLALLYFRFSASDTDFPAASEPKYDEDIFAQYLISEAKGDYVGMNNAFSLNMDETGVSFFSDEYDPTHGGLIYTYDYSLKLSDEEIAGRLYIAQPTVNISAQSQGENDYFALDRRSAADPEVVVYDSYRASSEALIRRLCEILLEHEQAHPSQWERTLESMVEEWEVHNTAYKMDYKIDHSKDVNLNNADENTDWIKRALEELS